MFIDTLQSIFIRFS